jgi:hypothetical protein
LYIPRNVIKVLFLYFVNLSESAVQTVPWQQLARHITAKNTLPKDVANQIPVWVKGQRQKYATHANSAEPVISGPRMHALALWYVLETFLACFYFILLKIGIFILTLFQVSLIARDKLLYLGGEVPPLPSKFGNNLFVSTSTTTQLFTLGLVYLCSE